MSTFSIWDLCCGDENEQGLVFECVFPQAPGYRCCADQPGFFFFWFSLNRVIDITEGLEAVKFIGSIYFPALSENVLASYWSSGRGAAGDYLSGDALAFRWFLPVLPI